MKVFHSLCLFLSFVIITNTHFFNNSLSTTRYSFQNNNIIVNGIPNSISYSIPQNTFYNEKYSYENMKYIVDQLINCKIDNYYILIQEIYNCNNGFTYSTNIDDIVKIAKYIKSNEKDVSVKIHTVTSPIILNSNLELWESQHYEYVNSLINALNSESIHLRWFIDFNENPTVMENPSFEPFVNNIMALASQIGKTGISFSGFDRVYSANSKIVSNLDCIAVNLYPKVGSSNGLANSQLSVSHIATKISSYNYKKDVKILKNKYHVPIILTEIGVCNIWEAYNSPEKWNWNNELSSGTVSLVPDGTPNLRYFQGVFIALENAGFDEISLWYNINYNLLIEFLKK